MWLQFILKGHLCVYVRVVSQKETNQSSLGWKPTILCSCNYNSNHVVIKILTWWGISISLNLPSSLNNEPKPWHYELIYALGLMKEKNFSSVLPKYLSLPLKLIFPSHRQAGDRSPSPHPSIQIFTCLLIFLIIHCQCACKNKSC